MNKFDREQEDKAQEEYIQRYLERREAKKRRRKKARDKVIGVLADIVTAVCSTLTNFLLWIHGKGKR